jgi:hypothetical protein
MLNHHVAQPKILRQTRQQQAQCFQTTGRGADTDNEWPFVVPDRMGLVAMGLGRGQRRS